MTKPKRIVQEVDWSHYGEPLYLQHEREEGKQVWLRRPFDLPAYMRIVRVIDQEKPGEKHTINHHIATTTEIDFYIMGVKVFLRYERPNDQHRGQLKLIAQTGDGKHELLETWEVPRD